ncbi:MULTISPECIES: hypothetical protein [Gimesia]|uniref:Uncharacterized protein n=2 Tax=Gimesia TaxID=1649453 RepID=A0A517V6F1_9PLAN|nr:MULTISPECIES: hypothetical protein [Gimesia]EDL56290.1 hypothetical protein PM8797T_08139 [Gimesia maris DSM 8797]QDT88580.1 hypothetical protein Pan161_01980 [Gimesia algae]QDU12448.1 hypothetical protein CA11_02270 [Gimesia maris]QEG14385.1 hypothetical protein GmarT_02200 [Gimesia maris]QGQ32176.1 hypothetical protein F1729_28020 [Gimesia maris]
MQKLPYRTDSTCLSDNDLILLDVLFDCDVRFQYLRQEVFCEQWNLGYSHDFDDDQLQDRLKWLCKRGVLEVGGNRNQPYFRITLKGDELWSEERCPIWDRFCTERYKTTSQKRTMMTVFAVSPQIRDDFLRLWPMYPARRRTATIADFGLVHRRSFPQLYVGVATYKEQYEWTPEEYFVYCKLDQEYRERLESERSWWRYVPELQKFILNGAES